MRQIIFSISNVVGVLFIGAFAEACLELPKSVQLSHSPFPFSQVEITSRSFSYKTVDGLNNTIYCQSGQGQYGWDVASYNGREKVSYYDYATIKGYINQGGKIFVDDKESGDKSTLSLGDTKDMAYGVISKPGHKAQLQITCKKDPKGVQTIAVKFVNNDGRAIGELSASKLTGTRSITMDKPTQGTIDFNSNASTNLAFAGCGAPNPQQGNGTRSSN